MTYFDVILESPDGYTTTIKCGEDQYIQDAADENGIELPYSCRAGACSSCAAKLLEGEVDDHEQVYLDEDQTREGYTLLCVAYPKSNCRILTEQEDYI